ncbi:hypothetical protein PsorP6_010518 [Peronosclerospora sorghi]|uniref:Uncharacterized protein n=1 Tax=Peronosclerospora sorghi TaxID=230839 RepID=A0ACC0VV41_9STRA|nr:hypothetical protein PsorP6_010518 [Peronosclerospora sorghi]
MTNGGGYFKAKKARQMEAILRDGVSIPSDRMCRSHTPMRALARQHGQDLVLAVGKDCADRGTVLTTYGFQHVVTVDQLDRHVPAMYPDVHVLEPLDHQGHFDLHAFRAVFVRIDPIVLKPRTPDCHGCPLLPERTRRTTHRTRRWHANMCPFTRPARISRTWSDFHLPRDGAGAFHALLETLFTRTTGHKLQETLYGKPQRTSFAFAATLLDAQYDAVERIYMVGDKPHTDIYGAKQAGGR